MTTTIDDRPVLNFYDRAALGTYRRLSEGLSGDEKMDLWDTLGLGDQSGSPFPAKRLGGRRPADETQ